ncbi:beta-ribofuranosylaminobenzene 5'-phosphate synthase family protein [Hyphomicrobium denitrificans 1NES1]|uniref:Beta-ribofuranosylaminobenzene 5'-phosphate synthase family protein n=1 Tax=Hyphomicrobium denitrificans 1NES1 TaxID=670307 RepID=N0B4J0_9HYPH|nr:beta-ribofuranosylaminobenzene 5'-phosphate synthase family protein [Hyphomicrobium denitrificans]AGK57923.1 beta-ribofuranosylaminobenzene 5'-phosphate synthase family protein [Hyphomicrobium denitrificans 1NES1]
MSLSPAPSATIRVRAPARLHLGFLDLNGAIGRRFGSIGLAVDQPETELTLTHATRHEAGGFESARALALVKKFAGTTPGGGYAVDVRQAIPAHAGLGSGTQLALAIGAAIARMEGRTLSPSDLAALGERGARSGIGLSAFASGGFIVDGGKGADDRPPPLTVRCDFPDDWRIMLILEESGAGVSGEAEATAFANLPEFPRSSAAHICHLVLMKLIPGLKETDLDAFGSALTEIQQIVGGYFASKQGGSVWTSPAVGRLAHRMRDLGAQGIGQSSWGPTGFAFVDTPDAAQRLYDSLVEEAKGDGLSILVARGRNTGASVEAI